MNVVAVQKNVKTSKWYVLHNFVRVGCEVSSEALALNLAQKIASLAGVTKVEKLYAVQQVAK